MSQTDPNTTDQKPFYPGPEELQVMGEQLLARVKELIHEGNVRRIIIKQEDRTIAEFPLTIGVAAGVAAAVFAPLLAAVGAIGALLTRCTIQVVRDDVPPPAGM